MAQSQSICAAARVPFRLSAEMTFCDSMKKGLEWKLKSFCLSKSRIVSIFQHFARQRAWNSICSANAQKGGACITIFELLEGESFCIGTFGRLWNGPRSVPLVGETVVSRQAVFKKYSYCFQQTATLRNYDRSINRGNGMFPRITTGGQYHGRLQHE